MVLVLLASNLVGTMRRENTRLLYRDAWVGKQVESEEKRCYVLKVRQGVYSLWCKCRRYFISYLLTGDPNCNLHQGNRFAILKIGCENQTKKAAPRIRSGLFNADEATNYIDWMNGPAIASTCSRVRISSNDSRTVSIAGRVLPCVRPALVKPNSSTPP